MRRHEAIALGPGHVVATPRCSECGELRRVLFLIVFLRWGDEYAICRSCASARLEALPTEEQSEALGESVCWKAIDLASRVISENAVPGGEA